MRKSAIIITSAAVVASLAGGAAAFAANTAPQATLATTSAATPAATPDTNSLGGAAPGSGPVGVASGNPADLDAAIAAALEETGPGTVVEADIDDDPTHAYEIDIRLDAGGFVEVKLDAEFGIVSVTPDDGSSDDASGESTGDDLPVTDDAVRTKAADAALAEVGTGTVTSVEFSDDADHVYEVEIDLGNGDDADVELDADFAVVKVD